MTFVKPVPYDISHASTSNLAQAGLDHRAQTASCLHLTVSCLRALANYGSSHCLQSELCQRATTAGKQPQPLGDKEPGCNPPASCHRRMNLEAFCMFPGRSRGITAVTSVTFLLPACLSILPLAPIPFMSISSQLLPVHCLFPPQLSEAPHRSVCS